MARETSLDVLDGGEDYTLSTPTNDYWLLLLTAPQGSTIFTDGFESGDTSALLQHAQ